MSIPRNDTDRGPSGVKPVDFVTDEGMRVRMTKDEHDCVVVRLSLDDGRNPVTFCLTPEEAVTFQRGVAITNTGVPVGEWGWDQGPVHIPSFNRGLARGLSQDVEDS